MEIRDIYQKKKQIRAIYKKKNKKNPNQKKKSKIISNRLVTFLEQLNYHKVISYISLPQEPNINLVNSYLLRNEKDFYIPIKIKKIWKIINLKHHSIYSNCSRALLNKSDIVLVPGVAFSTIGERIGKGGGTYDKYLSKCPAIKIGICFDSQLSKNLPQSINDEKMDILVTDKQIIYIKK